MKTSSAMPRNAAQQNSVNNRPRPEILEATAKASYQIVLFDIYGIIEARGHLADIRDFEAFDRTYSAFFSGVRPARTTVQSVLARRMKVEIDAIAHVPNK